MGFELERYVLDTGPLLTYLAVLYQDLSPHGPFESLVDPSFQNSTSMRNGLKSYFSSLKGRVLTTTGVIAEIHGHINQRRKGRSDQHQHGFWNITSNEYTGLALSERGIIFTELDLSIVQGNGPVDASLLRLAERLSAENYSVSLVTTEQTGREGRIHELVTAGATRVK